MKTQINTQKEIDIPFPSYWARRYYTSSDYFICKNEKEGMRISLKDIEIIEPGRLDFTNLEPCTVKDFNDMREVYFGNEKKFAELFYENTGL